MPTYQVMPDLSPEDYADLKSAIAAMGVQVAVEYDESGNILDGHHRVRACKELGITDWPRVVRVGMTEDQKREHARKINLARRHLTREQRQELIQQQLRETPEKSDRQIAAGLGVDNSTVSRTRQKMEDKGQLLQCNTSTGADGKIYPRQVERKTPCEQCKSAHPGCDDCCSTCNDKCNIQQSCRVQPSTPQQFQSPQSHNQGDHSKTPNNLISIAGASDAVKKPLSKPATSHAAEPDPEDKEIDRQHYISSQVQKMIFVPAGFETSDIDEAVRIYLEWTPLETANDSIERLREGIKTLEDLIAAFERTKRLKVVK